MPSPPRYSARTNHRKRHAAPVPNLHFVMIVASVAVILIAMTLYYLAPAAKQETLGSIAVGAMSFLFGKFSNSFGKALSAAPTVEAEPDEKDEEP